MRIHVDYFSYLTGTHPVVQVEKTPVNGPEGITSMNGKFLLPVPLDNDFPILAHKSGAFTGVSAASGSTGSRFTSATPLPLKAGELVTITGTANYNGVHVVRAVDVDLLWFETSVTFVATEAGAWEKGDYVVNGSQETDGYDLASQGMSRLLAAYPMFGNVYFNPLLTEDHVGELDFTFDFVDPDTGETFKPRLQTGRESPLDDSGQYPTHTALLPINTAVSPNRPGLLVSDEIDISAYTLDCDGNPAGTDEFMLWWKLYDHGTTEDVAADFGPLQGVNEPAIRQVLETDPEPTGFSAYISTDGGANWCPVGLLEPVAFCNKTKSIRIAFKNGRLSKSYIASFAVLF